MLGLWNFNRVSLTIRQLTSSTLGVTLKVLWAHFESTLGVTLGVLWLNLEIP